MASAKKVNTVTKKQGFFTNLYRYREYYIMLIPGILFFLVFCYGPMYGLVIAFQDYYPLKGISGSEFVGLKHFKALFSNPFFLSVLKNTLIISVYKLIVCFPAPIFLCIALNEIKNAKFKKSLSPYPTCLTLFHGLWYLVSYLSFYLHPEAL